MSRKVGQIIARGERRWLVRVYLGRDSEMRKRTYHNQTVYGSLRNAQAYLTRKVTRTRPVPRCRGSPGHSGRILGSLAENGRET
jgi:hypothetical protein